MDAQQFTRRALNHFGVRKRVRCKFQVYWGCWHPPYYQDCADVQTDDVGTTSNYREALLLLINHVFRAKGIHFLYKNDKPIKHLCIDQVNEGPL